MNIDITYIAVVLGVVFVSMTLHEVMHGYVAKLLGDSTANDMGRLTLNPLKHIDPFLTIILPLVLAMLHMPVFGGAKPVPFNPNRLRGGEWGAALVAAAGPLTNFLIAFVAFGFGAVTGVIGAGGIEASLGGVILSALIAVNLGFFIFNIIPVPPLDGSRILYAVAPDFVRQAMNVIERGAGLLIVFIVVMLGSQYIGQFIFTAESYILQGFGWLFGLK